MDQFTNDAFADTALGDSAAQRGGGRDSLFLAAELKIGDGDAGQVRVRNLSEGGLMAEYDGHVEIGEPVQIAVRGVGWVGGRIAWAIDGRLGIAFDRLIDPKRARRPVGTAGAKGAAVPGY